MKKFRKKIQINLTLNLKVSFQIGFNEFRWITFVRCLLQSIGMPIISTSTCGFPVLVFGQTY